MKLPELFKKINNSCIVCDGNFASATDDKHLHLHFWCAKCTCMTFTFNNKTKDLTYYKVMHVDGMTVELSKTKDDNFTVSIYGTIISDKHISMKFPTTNLDTWIKPQEELIEKINSLLILK